jgi:hypothetical protein
MRVSWTLGLLGMVLAVGLAPLFSPPARSADDKKPDEKADVDVVPFAGNWKVTILPGTDENTSFIVKLEDKEGKPAISLVWAAGELKDQTTVEDLKIDAKSIQFNLKIGRQVFAMKVVVPQGEKKPKVLLGSAKFGRDLVALQLESTESSSVEAADVNKPTEGAAELKKAIGIAEHKQKIEALRDLLQKNKGKLITLPASAEFLKAVARHADSEEDVAKATEQYMKTAAGFGPEMENQANAVAARSLLASEKGSALALEYARKVEAALPKDATPAATLPTLKMVAKALHKAKKEDDAKALDTRISKMDEELDKEFEKDAIPFKPEPFAGRKASSHRVALVELFTGAQCPPCVAADIAFDAAAQTFKPKEAVFLEYHLHIPGPDRLTNADTEARQAFYGDEIEGTPTVFVNGKVTPPLGGRKAGGKKSFETLRPIIEAALEKEAGAEMQLKAERKGDKIDLEARVFELKKPDDKLRLHIVLVEEVVRYPGSNGQRLHHDVVRAFIGGTEGTELKEATLKKNVTIDLAEIAKTQVAYMEDFEKKRSFMEDDPALDLKHVKIVAFIQDNASKEVIQAAQIEVPAAK